MFPWARSPSELEQGTALPKTGPRSFQGRWGIIAPFFLSALFFLSRFFAIFAPLPLLLFFMQKGRKSAWIATLSNLLVVGVLGGVKSLLFYSVFVAALSLTFPEMLLRKKSILKSAAVTLAVMGVSALLVGFAYSRIHHMHLWDEVTQAISHWVDYFTKSLGSNTTWLDPTELEDVKHSLVVEFPSAVATFGLILVWTNFVLLVKANPNSMREKLGIELASLKKWKTPDWFIWPTIASGFCLLGTFGLATDVALNVFKFLMAVYVIQGLSILSYFYDLWGVRGFFRVAGLLLPLILSAPLIAGLGFFDLWFDFRLKFRQS